MANAKFDGINTTNKRIDNSNIIDSIQTGARYKGTNHMGKKVAYEPQRLYNFELQIVGLDQLYTANNPGIGGNEQTVDGNNSGFIHYGNAAERIMVACSSFNVPDTTLGSIEIPHYNNTTKYAGKASFGDAQLVIESFLGSFTEQIMTTWAQCVYDPVSQNIGFKHDYAKDVYVIQYDTKGGTPRIWKLENAWPSVLPGAQWSYDGENRRQLNYTLKCDRCIPDYAIDFRTFSTLNQNYNRSNSLASAINSITGSALDASVSKGIYDNWSYNVSTGAYESKSTNEKFQSLSSISGKK